MILNPYSHAFHLSVLHCVTNNPFNVHRATTRMEYFISFLHEIVWIRSGDNKVTKFKLTFERSPSYHTIYMWGLAFDWSPWYHISYMYWQPRYSWNIVESDVKHHNPKLLTKLKFQQNIPHRQNRFNSTGGITDIPSSHLYTQ
jgi:hypothetical protein